MEERIYTIAINEAFDKYDGCPLCRMRDKLEDQTLSYTLGAAMMEPDVRIMMNRSGFCAAHLRRLHSMKNKLSLGLILESHIEELINAAAAEPSGGKKGLFSSKQPPSQDACDSFTRFSESCFICGRIRDTEKRYCSNTVYLWSRENSFREKLSRQPYFCLTHFSMLLSSAKNELNAAAYTEFYKSMQALETAYLTSLQKSVGEFNLSFDHRNSGQPLSDSARAALEKCLELLK